MSKKTKKQEEAPVIEEPVVENNKAPIFPKYPASRLAKSETFRRFGLHYDVLCAILGAHEYTVADAKLAVQKYIDSFNK